MCASSQSPDEGPDLLVDSIQSSALIVPGSSGVLLLSGGADSSALAFGLASLPSRPQLSALHLNYGLRPESGDDEAAARELCRMLSIELKVERPVRPPGQSGNLHAWAREERYRAAESLCSRLKCDWIAVAHTASDLAETVIYRLAVSPGSRPLAAMPARRGKIVRPILTLTREQVRAGAEAAGLPFVDDRSNDDPAFARARIRNEIVPVLTDLNPAFVRGVSRTRDDLAEEIDFLDQAAEALIRRESDGVTRIEASTLSNAHPALGRFALRALAERVLDRPVPVSREQTAEIRRLLGSPEGGRIDLGGGASLVAKSGLVTVDSGEGGRAFDTPGGSAPEPAQLVIPGELKWGGWEIRSTRMKEPFVPEGPSVATLDADRLGPVVEVRAWQAGDRIVPFGLGGSKSLQDLFTDSHVPRSRRHALPLLVSGGEIAWVPGLAVGEHFRLTSGTSRAIRLEAEPRQGSRDIPLGD